MDKVVFVFFSLYNKYTHVKKGFCDLIFKKGFFFLLLLLLLLCVKFKRLFLFVVLKFILWGALHSSHFCVRFFFRWKTTTTNLLCHHARDNTETASIDRRRSVNLVRCCSSVFASSRSSRTWFGRFERKDRRTKARERRSADDVNDDVHYPMADTTPTSSGGKQRNNNNNNNNEALYPWWRPRASGTVRAPVRHRPFYSASRLVVPLMRSMRIKELVAVSESES